MKVLKFNKKEKHTVYKFIKKALEKDDDLHEPIDSGIILFSTKSGLLGGISSYKSCANMMGLLEQAKIRVFLEMLAENEGE